MVTSLRHVKNKKTHGCHGFLCRVRISFFETNIQTFHATPLHIIKNKIMTKSLKFLLSSETSWK